MRSTALKMTEREGIAVIAGKSSIQHSAVSNQPGNFSFLARQFGHGIAGSKLKISCFDEKKGTA